MAWSLEFYKVLQVILIKYRFENLNWWNENWWISMTNKILSVYCSVSLSTFTLLCSHPTIYLQNFFNQMITSFPFLLTPGNYSTFVSMDLTILDTLMCGIIFSFCIWLILLVSMMFSTMLYHAPYFIPFSDWIIFCCIYTISSLSIDLLNFWLVITIGLFSIIMLSV